MYYPRLRRLNSQQMRTEKFHGLDRRPGMGDAACSEMQNMQLYPDNLLSTRKKRGLMAALNNPQGLTANGKPAWIDGGVLYFDGAATPVTGLTEGEKQMVCMGAYIVIFPDGKYYNTVKPEDNGSIDRLWTGSNVTISMCYVDGTDYDDGSMTVGTKPPENPADGHYWLDTSGEQDELKKWSEGNGEWVVFASVYIKISAEGIGEGIKAGDAVKLSGLEYNGPNQRTKKQVEDLNGTWEIMTCGDDYLVMIGLMDDMVELEGEIHADRQAPKMDYVIECNNRLWGCYHGQQDGETLNEIYASALGDFKNWRRYNGTSMDSYTVSVGTDGDFTGAIEHRGQPYFFKERYCHKIFGDKPGNYQMQTTTCDGVRTGCAKTLQVVNGTLYYLSINGVVAFETLPTPMDDAFSGARFDEGAACEYENQYIISMHEVGGEWGVYVLDTKMGMWVQEDKKNITHFARIRDEIYMLEDDGRIWTRNGSQGTMETQVPWEMVTSQIGYSVAEHKNIGRCNIRMKMAKGAAVQAYVEYDSSGEWLEAGSKMTNEGFTNTVMLPIFPRRCDHMRFKLEGTGDITIYSMTRQVYIGSDGG